MSDVLHYGGYTIRVVGEGKLKGTFIGYDRILTEQLAPLTMTPISARANTILSNFQSQRAILRLETTEINEHFKVNHITLWIKPMWSQFAG